MHARPMKALYKTHSRQRQFLYLQTDDRSPPSQDIVDENNGRPNEDRHLNNWNIASVSD